MATYIFAALALVSLVSVVIGRPWTIIPAKRTTDPEDWDHPLFKEANMVLSAGWTLVFALSALAVTLGGSATHWAVGIVQTLLGFASPWLGKRYAAWRAPAHAPTREP